MIALKKILLPTDFSNNSEWAIPYATAFAERFDAKIYILYVLENIVNIEEFHEKHVPFEQMAKDMRQALLSEARKKIEIFKQKIPENLLGGVEIIEDVPFLGIIKYAREKEIDMIIISTHGKTGLKHVLYGSVAEKVVRKMPCPVLSIRHPEHEFVLP